MGTSAPATPQLALWRALLTAMRPHQWTKNLLVFAALVFAKKFIGPDATRFVLLSLGAFAAFCAASSASYLLNDVLDAEVDRKHPLKRLRPVASGALPVAHALVAALLLAAGSIGGAFLLGTPFALTVVGYLVLQVGYSLALKHVVIMDVLCIAASFVLRAGAGALVIGVEFSHWLFICAALLALFLALAKRRHELVEVEDALNHRPILAEYSPQMLDQMIAVVTASCVTAYAFYTTAPSQVIAIDQRWIAEIESLDNIFPDVDYRVYAS